MTQSIYKVCLEEYSECFMKNFCNLLQLQKFVDVTIQCKDKSLKVHRVVLAANSIYFLENLNEDCKNVVIHFEWSSEVIIPIIEFMYYGKTSFTNKYAGKIIAAAKSLSIKGLSDMILEDSKEAPIFPFPEIRTMDTSKEEYSVQNIKDDFNMQHLIRIPFQHRKDINSEGYINAQSLKLKRGRPKKNSSNFLLKNMNMLGFFQEETDSQNVFNLLNLERENIIKEKFLIDAINSISEPNGSFGNVENNFVNNDFHYEETIVNSETESYNSIINGIVDHNVTNGETNYNINEGNYNINQMPILLDTSEVQINGGEDIICLIDDCRMQDYAILNENLEVAEISTNNQIMDMNMKI